MRTVRVRQRSCSTNGAHRRGVCAICELEPIFCIWLEVRSFDFEREVDVVGRKSVARVKRLSGQLRVVEDLERDTDGDILARYTVDGHGTSP